MITTVQGNKAAIGYISLGSLDKSKVKALKVDGAEAAADNVKSGEYKVARPFNIATKGDATGVASDFIKFILSADGQAVVEKNGYISEGMRSIRAFRRGRSTSRWTTAPTAT